jgi:glycosyltransferase involved in cell wall biosynthesis
MSHPSIADPEHRVDCGINRDAITTTANVFGYFGAASGLGSAARGYVRALDHLGVGVKLVDLSGPRQSFDHFAGSTEEKASAINLVCLQHFAAPAEVSAMGERYTIGVWAWELPRFPEKFHKHFRHYDEIWVGSRFIADAVAPVSPVPVVRIPPVLTPVARGSRERGRQQIGAAADEFAFLFVFDFTSYDRKNPLAVIDAFAKAFAQTESATLIVKCVGAEFCPAEFAEMKEKARGRRIQIIAEKWSPQEMQDLTEACDAYVSLHRAEGTGLTISDAMSAGKPVIATEWSGNMDFMNASNSLPVEFELTTLPRNVGIYPAGETWAEPSVQHAARLMRSVFENPAMARALGEAARAEIATNYSDAAIAALIDERLRFVSTQGQAAVAQRLARNGRELDERAQYRGLVAGVRQIAARVIPPGASVAVVSKGDENLLALDGLCASHFPQTHRGLYAGRHPADSDEAIASLKDVRSRGAEYLLLPGTSFWWLDHYRDFARHLESSFVRKFANDDCIVYELTPSDFKRAEA